MSEIDSPGRATPPYEHLAEETVDLLNATMQRKLDRIDEDVFIHWDDAEETLLEIQRYARMPNGTRRPVLLILGESGMGKSTTYEEFCLRAGINAETGIGRSGAHELFYMSLAGVNNAEEFLLRVFRTIGHPFSGSRDARKNGPLDLAASALKRLNLRMMILDECQQLAEIHANESAKICSHVRHLSNTCQRPMIMMGSEDTLIPVERSIHLMSRVDLQQMPRWECVDELRVFVDALLSYIPLPEPSPITDDKSLEHLIEWTKGVTEFIVKSIRKAARGAIRSRESCITFKRLEKSRHRIDKRFENRDATKPEKKSGSSA